MSLLRGRHADVMAPGEYKRARSRKDLPDVYVGSAEWEVEFDDDNFNTLLNVTTDLPEAERHEIERREGLRATPPWGLDAPDPPA
jgi:hypothetical protein